MNKKQDVYGDAQIPLIHRIYLALRNVHHLRQSEIAALRVGDIRSGIPLPIIHIEPPFGRERPIHPSVVIMINAHARQSYLARDKHLITMAEARRMEADWRTYSDDIPNRQSPLFDWFRGTAPGNWEDGCRYLLSAHICCDERVFASNCRGGLS